MFSLKEAERNFFINRGIETTPNEPLNNIKRRYFLSIGIKGNINEQKIKWLRKIIADLGGQPKGFYVSGLLKQTLNLLGLPIEPFQGGNWRSLYLNYKP